MANLEYLKALPKQVALTFDNVTKQIGGFNMSIIFFSLLVLVFVFARKK